MLPSSTSTATPKTSKWWSRYSGMLPSICPLRINMSAVTPKWISLKWLRLPMEWSLSQRILTRTLVADCWKTSSTNWMRRNPPTKTRSNLTPRWPKPPLTLSIEKVNGGLFISEISQKIYWAKSLSYFELFNFNFLPIRICNPKLFSSWLKFC